VAHKLPLFPVKKKSLIGLKTAKKPSTSEKAMPGEVKSRFFSQVSITCGFPLLRKKLANSPKSSDPTTTSGLFLPLKVLIQQLITCVAFTVLTAESSPHTM